MPPDAACEHADQPVHYQPASGEKKPEEQELRQDRPMRGIDEMVERVKKCRARRPKLLLALWEAAQGTDQKAFDKALIASVKYFLKHDAEDVPNSAYWVALHQSFLWLLAERNGLEFPADASEEVEAAVVRRQTIGLA